MPILLQDNFKLAPAGVLGSVHNPQITQTGFTTWTDPVSTPLETVLGVGATYDDVPFFSSVTSILDGTATPYALPAPGFELRSVLWSPTGSDNRLVTFILYFNANVAFQERAKITIRWQGNSMFSSMRLLWAPQNGAVTSVLFNGPAALFPTLFNLRVRITPTNIQIYDGLTLLKSQNGTFSYATNLHEVGLLFSSLTTAPMTSYIVEDLTLTSLDYTPATSTDLVIADAAHALFSEVPFLTMFPDFPDDLPCVSRIDGFGMALDSGVIRTPFEAGNTRQRRLQTQLPKKFQFAWRCNNAQLHPLFTWLNIHGYDWFNISLSGTESSALDVFATKVPVRIISDITVSLMQVYRQNWWILACTAEKYEPVVLLDVTPPVTIGWFEPPWSGAGLNASVDNEGTNSDRIGLGDPIDMFFGIVGGADASVLDVTPVWTPVGVGQTQPTINPSGDAQQVIPQIIAGDPFDYGEGTLDITASLDGIPCIGRLRVVFAGSSYQSITWTWNAV